MFSLLQEVHSWQRAGPSGKPLVSTYTMICWRGKLFSIVIRNCQWLQQGGGALPAILFYPIWFSIIFMVCNLSFNVTELLTSICFKNEFHSLIIHYERHHIHFYYFSFGWKCSLLAWVWLNIRKQLLFSIVQPFLKIYANTCYLLFSRFHLCIH